jgi:YVTN family beta-propeller protein
MQKPSIAILSVTLLAAAGCSSSPAASTSHSINSRISSGSPDRKAYVGLFGEQAVAVLDTETRQVLTKIPVTAPDGLILTPDGTKLYVASGDTGTVQVISTDSDTIVTSIDVGAKPAGLAITPDGRRVVASVAGANQAVLIDTDSDAVVDRVAVGQAHASCISADGRFAYVGSQATGAPAIVRVDIAGNSPPTSFSVDKAPRMLSCAASKIYFTAVGLDAVEVIDPDTGAPGADIPSGGSPHDVRPTQDGMFELTVSQTVGDLEFIDPLADAVVASVPTGKLPHWIALTIDGTRAYVTNEGDDDISIVDLATRRVTDTIAIGAAPRKMALRH